MCDVILNEIQDVKSLLQSFGCNLIQMISCCDNLGPLEAARLTDALKSGSPFGEGGATSVIAAIDAKIHATSTSEAHRARGTSKGQLLVHWWNHLTKEDWATLKDEKRSLSVKTTTLVERGNLLGIVCYDQHTYGWMMALLLILHYEESPPARKTHNKLLELKSVRMVEK